jgi:hypothetical protein
MTLEPPTTEVTGFLLHRPLPLLVLHGFHRRNFRQFLPYKLLLNRVYNTQSFMAIDRLPANMDLNLACTALLPMGKHPKEGMDVG